jgi:hypothetical protein
MYKKKKAFWSDDWDVLQRAEFMFPLIAYKDVNLRIILKAIIFIL